MPNHGRVLGRWWRWLTRVITLERGHLVGQQRGQKAPEFIVVIVECVNLLEPLVHQLAGLFSIAFDLGNPCLGHHLAARGIPRFDYCIEPRMRDGQRELVRAGSQVQTSRAAIGKVHRSDCDHTAAFGVRQAVVLLLGVRVGEEFGEKCLGQGQQCFVCPIGTLLI
jgi:hypothetical protein